MIILTMEQRSPEWFQARLGRPTASNAAKILTSQGKISGQWLGYLYDLVAERAGYAPEPFEPTEAMLEGIRREEESRNAYAFLTDSEPVEVGMIVCTLTGASASPDGLVGYPDGPMHGLELKNPKASTFFKEKITGKVPTQYIPQLHMSMAVSGLERWDYGCYLPGQDLLIHEVLANDYTETMRQAVADFCGELDKVCDKLDIPKLEELTI